MLLARRAFCGASCRIMAGECFGENTVYAIGPTAIVLDDFVGDFDHFRPRDRYNYILRFSNGLER
jgi:hypothetical protein